MKRLAVLSLLLAGCGKVESELPDAPVADAPIDAPSAPVTVTVLTTTGDGAPNPNAKVVFIDADGTVTYDGPVDAEGKASAMLPHGGTVLSIDTSTDTAERLLALVTSVSDVKPGDDITLGNKRYANITNGGGQTMMTANYTPSSGATGHTFYTACGSSGGGTTSPATLRFYDSCHGASFDLLGVTSGLTPPRYVRLTGVTYESGGTFTIPTGFGTMPNFTLTTTNVPAEITDMTVGRSTVIENLAVARQSVPLGEPGTGTITTAIPYPPSIGARSELRYDIKRSDLNNNSQRLEVHTATLANAATVDMSALHTPWLVNVAMTSTGATWTAEGDGTPDAQTLVWVGSWMTTRQVTIQWIAFSPYASTGATLPRLPASYAELDPGAQASVTSLSGGVVLADYDLIDGYPEFRLQPFSLISPSVDNVAAFAGMAYQRRINSISYQPVLR